MGQRESAVESAAVGMVEAHPRVPRPVSTLLKNPAPCFDRLSISGSPPRISCTFSLPLTLSLSKGELVEG
jgi:hypothetical protein